MVKGNNHLPDAHYHRWCRKFTKTWFNQPARKQSRRLARQDKVAKNGLRPIGLLRPAVHPPTQRYNLKIRAGRGFTLDEIKAVGVSRKVARSIGISVDHRRKNRCEESLTMNVDRLKTYLGKLAVFPRKGTKARKGFGGVPNDTLLKDVVNKVSANRLIEANIPLPRRLPTIEFRAPTAAEKNSNVYQTLQLARKPPKPEKKKE